MAEDYGRQTAAPGRITLGGVEYLVSKMGPRIYGELQQWLKQFVPDPRTMFRDLAGGASDAVALQIWGDLMELARDWPPGLDSPEGNMYLHLTWEGATQVVWSLLRRHNGSLTLEKAREIAADITTEELSRLVALSRPEPDFSPKAPAEADGRATTTTDRGPVAA